MDRPELAGKALVLDDQYPRALPLAYVEAIRRSRLHCGEIPVAPGRPQQGEFD
jgi:hypothetical protein